MEMMDNSETAKAPELEPAANTFTYHTCHLKKTDFWLVKIEKKTDGILTLPCKLQGADVFAENVLSFHQESGEGQMEIQTIIGHLAETFNSFASFQPGKKKEFS